MRRAVLWGAVVLAQIINVSAWATEPGWIADPKSGCKVWDAYPRPKEGISWNGPCKNGTANGSGTAQWYLAGKFSERDDGEWIDGKMNGHGVYTTANGDRYDGEFRDGFRNGHGVKTWANGDRYDGQWIDGKKNGYGTYAWPDGKRYDGQWRADFPNGHGVYAWPDGSRYEGNWTNGCFKQGNRTAWVGKTKEQCGF